MICPVASDDVDNLALKNFPRPTLVVSGPVGLPAQRNKILSAATTADIIIFFDDDFFADAGYIENLENIFLARPDVIAATGVLLADGAQGPGFSVEQGLRIIRCAPKSCSPASQFIECYGTYGCNMAFRLKTIIGHDILFDENLPLYGWQEDIDFSQRVLPYGRIVKSAALRGVHLGNQAWTNLWRSLRLFADCQSDLSDPQGINAVAPCQQADVAQYRGQPGAELLSGTLDRSKGTFEGKHPRLSRYGNWTHFSGPYSSIRLRQLGVGLDR